MRKLLEKAEILPKRPPPFGSLFTTEKKPRYMDPMQDRSGLSQKMYKRKMAAQVLLQQETERLYKNEFLERQALERGKMRADKSELKTTDIEANDSDAESRVESFAEISRRLSLHLEDMGEVSKGSDYRTAAYIRKLSLLAKKGLG